VVGARPVPPSDIPRVTLVEAAFFDLDKTVIARPSMMAFGPAFHRQGLINRRALARGLWTQLLYVRFGAGPERLDRIRHSALAITRGWSQAEVSRIVDDSLRAALAPITYAGAVDLIAEHRAAGRRVYIVSAAPAEIVGPVAAHLGAHEAIATQGGVDADGRYTGEMERYCYGPAKAALIREVAERDGIDLAASWAYSDSATDLPMLEVVGHPVAVNPDRSLRQIAELRGWAILRFDRIAVIGPVREVRDAGTPAVRLGMIRGSRQQLGATLLLVALGSGGAAWWALRRLPRSA
jgi:HAD superfamily hydrolase (TIGR01490 family)